MFGFKKLFLFQFLSIDNYSGLTLIGITAQKFVHSADKNKRAAEKKQDIALLIGSNASRKGSQEIMKAYIPKHKVY